MKKGIIGLGIAAAGAGLLWLNQKKSKADPEAIRRLMWDEPTGRWKTRAELLDALSTFFAGLDYPPNREQRRVMSWVVEIERAAQTFRLYPALIAAVIAVESEGFPDKKTLEKQGFYVYGLMQVRGATADLVAQAGLMPRVGDWERLIEPELSVMYGSAYLRWQRNRYAGKMNRDRWVVSAYNGGTAFYERGRFRNEGYVGMVLDDKLPGYAYLFHQLHRAYAGGL